MKRLTALAMLLLCEFITGGYALLLVALIVLTACTLYPEHHPRSIPNERVCKVVMAVEQCHAENSPAPFYLAIAEDGTWTIPDRRLQLRKRYCSEFWYGQERRPCSITGHPLRAPDRSGARSAGTE